MEQFTCYLDAETTSGSHINADLLSYSAILVRDKDLKIVDSIDWLMIFTIYFFILTNIIFYYFYISIYLLFFI